MLLLGPNAQPHHKPRAHVPPCCVLTRLVAGGMQYYAAVSHTDEQIGRVLDELRQSGLRKSTVVCFFT